MPKAKLSQIAATWMEEDSNSKNKETIQEKKNKKISKTQKEQPKKKQTFSLKAETIKCLWVHRVETGRNISKTIDDLVKKYLSK